jgi:hypothetical protein
MGWDTFWAIFSQTYLGTMLWFFLNIFAEIFGEKIVVFDSKQSQIMHKFDHNIGF